MGKTIFDIEVAQSKKDEKQAPNSYFKIAKGSVMSIDDVSSNHKWSTKKFRIP